MGHNEVDVFLYESDLSLIINDSLNQYFGKESEIDIKERLLKYAIEKRKGGVSILSDMGCYFFKSQYKDLIDYELSLSKHSDELLKRLCMYNELDFNNRLTEEQKRMLVDHHSIAINLEFI
jgi:hypothetical protein